MSKIYDRSKRLGMKEVHRCMDSSPKDLATALSEMGRRQRWRDALAALLMLTHAGRSRLTIEACDAVVTCCAASGPWQGSLEILRLARSLALQHSLVTAGNLIKVTGSPPGLWCNAGLQLSRMRQLGMSPTIRHHNTVLSCGLMWSAALGILKSVLDDALEPTEFTSSLLMKKLEANWPAAISTFLSIQRLRVQHDAISGNAALKAASRHRRVSQDFVRHLIGAGVPIDSATCSSAAPALESEQVLDLLKGVRALSQEPDIGAYTSALTVLDNDGRWEAALVFLQSMVLDGIQAWKYTKMRVL